MMSARSLYRIAAIAAAVALLGTVFDIVLASMPGWGTETVPLNAAAWLEQLAGTPWLGLRNLDLLNVAISLIAVPMYVALTVIHKEHRPASALLGLAFVGLGTTVFAASNAALPMLDLSRQWGAAGAAERVALAAAAQALLARGAHGSMGAFPAFFLSELGTLSVAVAMLSGALVSRRIAWLGIVGAASLVVYTVLVTFGSMPSSLVVGLAAPGGIMMIVWQGFVARRLWQRAA